MTAVDQVLHARRELDALESLLRGAAMEKQPAQAIADEALKRVEQARRILDSMVDEEGTE